MPRSNHLIICYDPGTSLSKILYQIGTGSVRYLTMQPEVITLPAASASSLPTTSGLGKPEDNAWIRLQSDGDCYAVGRVAQEYRATVSIKKLKYESLVPKILAALGAIATKEELRTKFSLDLAILIPFGEYANRVALETELNQALSSFYFQERQYQIKLKRYRCLAEAVGLVFSSINYRGINQFQNQTLAYLMLGYRNTSLLLFREGTLSQTESNTTQLGFYDFIDKLTAKVSGISREEVQAAIITLEQAYHNLRQARRDYRQVTRIMIDDLIKASNPEKIAKERVEIETAIHLSMSEYWQLIQAWLQESLPPLRQLNGLIYCGGASHFLQEEIQDYFQEQITILEPNSFQEIQLLEALDLDEFTSNKFKQQNLTVRFADVWGLFMKFADYQMSPSEKAA